MDSVPNFYRDSGDLCLETFTKLLLVQSRKFNRISLNETFEFPFRDLNICVDFDLRDFKKNGEYKETK